MKALQSLLEGELGTTATLASPRRCRGAGLLPPYASSCGGRRPTARAQGLENLPRLPPGLKSAGGYDGASTATPPSPTSATAAAPVKVGFSIVSSSSSVFITRSSHLGISGSLPLEAESAVASNLAGIF